MDKNVIEASNWDNIYVDKLDDLLDIFDSYKRKKWVFRGHHDQVVDITSKFDRLFDSKNLRSDLLQIENEFIDKDINLFVDQNKNIIYFQNLKYLWLGKLKHYEGPTRLVDWSSDPLVASFFMCYKNWGDFGEVWAFDAEEYNRIGSEQWKGFVPPYEELKNEVLSSNSNLPQSDIDTQIGLFQFLKYISKLFFDINQNDKPFFMCLQNPWNFTRIKNQKGFFTISSDFGTSHSTAITNLFGNRREFCKRYIVPSIIIKKLEKYLLEEEHLCAETLGLLDDRPFENYIMEKTSEIKSRYRNYLIPTT
ncbi:MAG: FRG domain-containing protein [Leptolinea sp.]|jgi:hypothetical protein|nr:FRG domain-containing protein [Leptolinea sp.]